MVSTNLGAQLQNVNNSLVDAYVALLLLIIFLSLVGNIVVLTALYTQQSNLRNSMDIFIVNMAVSDIMSSFSGTFTLNNAKLQWSSGVATCKVCYYLLSVSYAVSILTLCFASVDRFLGICLPTKHRQVFLLKNQVISICLIWILSGVLFAPYIYAFDVKEFKLSNEKTKELCTQTWSSDSEQIFFTLVIFSMLFLSPVVLFVFVFFNIYQKLLEPRSSASGGNAILHKRRRRMTLMLLLMITFQYICWSPSIFANLAHIFGKPSPNYFNLWLVFELLHLLRSMIYPLIYFTMYLNVRESLKALYISFKSTARSNLAENTTTSQAEDVSLPSSVPVSSAASDRSVSYIPDNQ